MSAKITPASKDFTLANGLAIYKGSEWAITISVAEQDCLERTPFDLTGYTGKCSIKEKAGDDVPLAEPVVTINDAVNGTFTISLSSDLTANIPTNGKTYNQVSKYQYDIYLIDGDSNSYRALQGMVEVSPSVTEEDD